MRNKRMFCLDVVDTDMFLDMPSSAQALYFHLGMRADDNGFVSSPKRITNMVNCGNDDFKLLIAKGYLIPFASGVVVIKHWKQNNYIRADRYNETKMKKELEMLECSEGVYSLKLVENLGEIPGDNHLVYQTVAECHTQKKETVTVENNKDNICASEPDARKSDFELIYAIYPKKKGKQRAYTLYCQWIKGKVVNGTRVKLTNRQIYIAVRNYVEQQQREEVDLQYWKNFDTLMGQTILDYVPEDNENE